MAVTQYTADVGDTVSVSCNHQTGAPPWMTYNGSNAMSGTAKLPSGFTRMRHSDPVFGLSTTGLDVDTAEITVNPVALPADTSSPWRCAVYAPNGSYIIMNGLNGIPTVGTPTVRLSDSAPSKAVVRIPLARGADNVRAPTFAKWSDGHAEMLKRGMEMTVEFRDSDTGLLTMVFRGRIYQMESADSVVITAYDRLMDLAQFSDQYQPDLSQADTKASTSRTTSGANYVYTYPTPIGAVLGGTAINEVKVDPRASMSGNGTSTINSTPILCQDLPSYSGTAPYKESHISKVGSSFHIFNVPPIAGSIRILSAQLTVRLYKGTTQISTASASTTPTGVGDYSIDVSVDWTLTSDPSEYWVGSSLSVIYYVDGQYYPVSFAYKVSSTRYTATRFRQWNGSSWTTVSPSDSLPELMMQYTAYGGTIPTSSMTASGTTVTVPQSSFPSPGAVNTYVTMIEGGVGLVTQYTVSGSIDYATVVKELIRNAGLSPNVPDSADFGSCDYYTTSTFDYLSCIRELLASHNYGIRDSVDMPGRIGVAPKYTVDDTPVRYLTTSPSGTGERIVTAHDLTAHWMAEKATVAYITEGTNVLSGYPIAVETDDRLYNDSVAEAVGSPLRQVTVDTSMGTHDAMAKAAGGKMVQLHTNVFEGTVTLAGYRLNLWDLYGSGEGGMPVGINVPEYDAQGTAVPTEMILGDGSTILTLDNIRTADRSEVANSMNLTNDAISNGSSQLPSVVYIFARTDKALPVRSAMNTIWTNRTITGITIVDEAGNALSAMTDVSFIKMFEDSAGYAHVAALFTPNPQTPYASNPIHSVVVSNILAVEQFILDNPKTVAASQGIHIDIRFEKP